MSSNVWKRTTAVAGRILLALAIVALLPATAAFAQAGKVAVIDVQRLVTDSVAGKEALARLKKLQDDKIAEGKAKNEEVDGSAQAPQRRAAFRSPTTRSRSSRSSSRRRSPALRRFQEDAERDFNKSRETHLRRDRAAGVPGHRAGRQGGRLHLHLQQVPERPAVRRRGRRHHRPDHPALRRCRDAEGELELDLFARRAGRAGGRRGAGLAGPAAGRSPDAVRGGPDAPLFLTSPRYLEQAVASAAGAVLVGRDAQLPGRDLLRCAQPQLALAAILRLFHPRRRRLARHPSDRGRRR